MKIIFPSEAQPEGCKYTFLYNTPSPAAAFKARLPVFIFVCFSQEILRGLDIHQRNIFH